MFKNPPLPLILAAVVYLGYETWSLAVTPTGVAAGRLALSAVLFLFVLRGSRVAARIMAVLTSLSALILLVAAIATFTRNPTGAIVFTIIAGLLALFAVYVCVNPKVRAFQERASARVVADR
jgi:hypothetical protein